MLCCALLCCVVLCCAVLCCVVWRGVAWCGGRLYVGWCRRVGAVVCGGIIGGKSVDWYGSELVL